MTDKQKLEKIKMLADEMYYRMQNLSTDTSGIRKAMYDYHQFIIYEYYKEEPVSNDLEEAANDYAHDIVHDDVFETFIAGAQWQKRQLVDKAWEYIDHQLNLPSDFEVHFRKAMEE